MHYIEQVYHHDDGRSVRVVQLQLTDRDLLELELRRRADRDLLVRSNATRHRAAMDGLAGAALRLHTTAGALAALGVSALLVVAMIVARLPPLGYLAPVTYACLDWHNVATLHGAVNWPLLRYTNGRHAALLAMAGYVLGAPLIALVYCVQCAHLAGAVAQAREARRQAHIGALEHELGRYADSIPEIPLRST